MKTFNHIQSIILQEFRIKVLLIAAISFLMIEASKSVSAQKLAGTAYMEQNIMGLQKGIQLSTSIWDKARVAYFFQATSKFSLETSGQNYPFHGINISLPVSNCGNLKLWASLKTGLVNGKYLITTPQINTELTVLKHVNLGVTTGYRAGHAAVGTSISFTL